MFETNFQVDIESKASILKVNFKAYSSNDMMRIQDEDGHEYLMD